MAATRLGCVHATPLLGPGNDRIYSTHHCGIYEIISHLKCYALPEYKLYASSSTLFRSNNLKQNSITQTSYL